MFSLKGLLTPKDFLDDERAEKISEKAHYSIDSLLKTISIICSDREDIDNIFRVLKNTQYFCAKLDKLPRERVVFLQNAANLSCEIQKTKREILKLRSGFFNDEADERIDTLRDNLLSDCEEKIKELKNVFDCEINRLNKEHKKIKEGP